jgi:hypothetical protein
MSISLSLAPLSIVFSLRVRFAVCHTSFYTDSALIAVFAQPIPPGKTAAASTICAPSPGRLLRMQDRRRSSPEFHPLEFVAGWVGVWRSPLARSFTCGYDLRSAIPHSIPIPPSSPSSPSASRLVKPLPPPRSEPRPRGVFYACRIDAPPPLKAGWAYGAAPWRAASPAGTDYGLPYLILYRFCPHRRLRPAPPAW